MDLNKERTGSEL